MRKLLCAAVVIFGMFQATAQQFGGNPPSVRWRQLNTDSFRVIYPQGLDTTAKRVSTIIQKLTGNPPHALGAKGRKIDIVLQNQPVTSNGYVGLGPYRSEFYLTPPADNFDQGGVHWPDQLALHEFRHVHQYNNFNKGLSRVMGTLFGQEGYAVAVNAAIPNWFFEGDAVYQETSLSTQGRGRMPSFLRAFPSLWQAGKEYSWMKLRNGSLKDYVPDHYDLGYLLTNYGYQQYGTSFWKKVTDDAARYRGLFYPMQKAVKRNAGIPYWQFVNDAFLYYKAIYGQTAPPQGIKTTDMLLPANEKILTNYYYPQWIDSSTLIYLKTSNKKRPALYILKNKKEQLLRYRDISIDEQFSYNNGKIVYAAIETDPRWSWKTYSNIKLLEVPSGAQRTITKHTRYFSPDISADGKYIAANEVDDKGNASLVILESDGGGGGETFSEDGVDYFANPKFIKPGLVAAAIRKSEGTMFIGLIDLDKHSLEALTPPTFKTVGQISLDGSKIFFTGADGLKDGLFSVDIQTKEILRLHNNEQTGYFPHSAANRLVWSSFTAEGYQLREKTAATKQWVAVSATDFATGSTGMVADSFPAFIAAALQQDQSLPTSKKYARFTRPLNFHSWRPNYADPEYSFTVYGENILNTLQTELYYLYNENDRTHAVGGNLTYAGWFPYIGMGTQYTMDRTLKAGNRVKEWNQWDHQLSVTLPFNWIKGRQYRYLQLGTHLGYRMDYSIGPGSVYFPSSQFGYLTHNVAFGQQIQKAVQDIFPRWGFGISAQYRYAINKWNSRQFFGTLTGYLPGLFPTHHLVLSASVQESSLPYQLFGNRINFARGYNGVDSARMGTLALSYHLPVWYPDWGFANLFYLQRIRAAAFYDYMGVKGKRTDFYHSLQSAGMEIYFDTRWWNQHPVSLGFRSGQLLTRDLVAPGRKWFYELILPVSLIPR